jgi:hypothetical protein
MDNILAAMHDVAEMNEGSVFFDIGSGMGKPQLHATIRSHCLSYGIDVNEDRVGVGRKFRDRIVEQSKVPVPQELKFSHFIFQDASDGEDSKGYSYERPFHNDPPRPPSHIYSFCARFSKHDRYKMVRKLNHTAFKVLALTLNPVEMGSFGIRDVDLVKRVEAATTGKQGFTFYIYKKVDRASENTQTIHELFQAEALRISALEE